MIKKDKRDKEIQQAEVLFSSYAIEIMQEEWMERVKFYIRLIGNHSLQGTVVGSVLDDALNVSGKMIRVRLLLLCSVFGSHWREKKDRLCILAAMVELTHLASLIHDDIIDDAPYRRGGKSLQNKYGKDAAVYAGDFLMARIYYYEAVEHLNESAAVLSKAVQSMCEGEIGQALCRYKENITVDEYFWNIRRKTASLFKAACHIGAAESGCSDEFVKKLETFGENLGMMFQLRDDLLDFISDKTETGKETHKDFRYGIYTYPVLAALKTERGKNLILPIMLENKQRMINNRHLAEMEEYVIQCGGIEATYKEIKRFAQKNKEILRGLNMDDETTRLIQELMKQLEV